MPSGGTAQSAGGGSETGGGRPQLIGRLEQVTEETALETLAGYREELARLDHEVNISVTASGQVWRTEGGAGTVHPEQIEAEGGSLAGSYSLHNHPPQETYFSFSADDIGFFFRHLEQYSEAFDHRYRYYMRRTTETPDMVMMTHIGFSNRYITNMLFNFLWMGKSILMRMDIMSRW